MKLGKIKKRIMSTISPRRNASTQSTLLCPVCQKKFSLYACLENKATNHINRCIASLERKMRAREGSTRQMRKDENNVEPKTKRSTKVSKKRKGRNDDARPSKKGRSRASQSRRKSALSSHLSRSSSSTPSSSSVTSTKRSVLLKKPTQKMISPFIQHVLASQGKSRETECT